MKVLRLLLIALQFLTRLPTPLRDAPSEAEIGRSVLFYPVAGLLIGMLLALFAAAASALRIPESLAAALVLAAWVLVSGGLHLDGLADSADAWVGGRGERERTLEIMKDPRCGPIAVATVVVILLLKFSALAALMAVANGWPVALAPVLGRAVLPLLFLTTPYVRPGGLGSAMSAHLPRKAAAVSILTTCGIILTWFGRIGFLALIAALAVFILLRRMMIALIGGTTGDTAGALVELTETAVIIAAAAFHG